MKKLLIFFLVVAVIGLVAYAGYRYYLPASIAKSLTSGQESPLVPDEVLEEVEAFKSKIATDVGDLPLLMVEGNIDYADLEIMLDRLNPDDLTDALVEMSSVTITSANQAFDIVTKHVKIEGYDLERFRDMFVRNINAEEIPEAMEIVRDYELLLPMGMSVAKEVAKDLMASSREEIERRLAALNSNE